MTVHSPSLIVHVVYRFAVGGLENGLVNLINRLPPDSWRHFVIALTEIDKDFCQRVKRSDVRYLALRKRPGHAVPLYPRLFRLFHRLRPAIVHTRNLAALEASVPAWAARAGTRLHGEHGWDVGDLDGSNARHRWTRRAFRPFVTQYLALSPQLEIYLRDRVGVPPDRIEQIYNGVDTSRFCPPTERAPIAGCPFQSSDLWLIGTVGRMEPVKDQPNLARAFVKAVQRHPGARRQLRLIIVGAGPRQGEVETILRDAGVRDLVWFAGEREDVPALLQGMDCFVLPSRAEGVSNTILEAMSSGLPVVATRVGANAELVEDGITGRLVEAGDSDALALEIGLYSENPAMARRHGRAGRSRVERHFSLETMVERYDGLYSRLLRRGAAPHKAPGARPGRRAVG